MKQRPILFSTEMVKAILEGRKTQTRRMVKPQPRSQTEERFYLEDQPTYLCPYGQPGDRLWVRETFYAWGHWTMITTTGINSVKREYHFHDLTHSENKPYLYEDCPPEVVLKRWGLGYHKRPSIFMPRIACRILLEVTDRRVERLQDISEEDAIAEGIGAGFQMNGGWPDYEHIVNGICTVTQDTARMSYWSLWDKINGEGSWDKNPWVWVITFKSLKP